MTLNWEVFPTTVEDWHTIPSYTWILVIDVKSNTKRHWLKNADDPSGDE